MTEPKLQAIFYGSSPVAFIDSKDTAEFLCNLCNFVNNGKDGGPTMGVKLTTQPVNLFDALGALKVNQVFDLKLLQRLQKHFTPGELEQFLTNLEELRETEKDHGKTAPLFSSGGKLSEGVEILVTAAIPNDAMLVFDKAIDRVYVVKIKDEAKP